MKGYCDKHKCHYEVYVDGKWITKCPQCAEEDEHKGEIISGLAEIAEHFKMVQRTQQEAGRYVSVNFKRFENICIDAMKLLEGR